ncbi:MAG: DsbA family protein, partial [Actinomycetota bacterium]|nr:DsbA family protein [Actinomycetota bacterium]
MAVHVLYVTDPACPWSWGAEPRLRRIEAEFGEDVRITYVMGGLWREVDASVALRQVLDASAESGMPADPRLWLDSPPTSSYPACLAVKAAAEQGLDGPYLRRLREALMCERVKADNRDAFVSLARGVPGMNVDRFANDLGSNAIVEAFGADLERARALGTEMPGFVVEGDAPRQPPPSVEEALRRWPRMAVPEVAAACD